MPDWSSGYVLDIPYTSGFYRELAPTYLQFVLHSQSLRAPALGPGATYCELGCGQGSALRCSLPPTRSSGSGV